VSIIHTSQQTTEQPKGNKMQIVTFNNRKYEVIGTFPVTPFLAKTGIVEQLGLQGKRGASGLMTKWNNGTRRVLWLTPHGARTEAEFPNN